MILVISSKKVYAAKQLEIEAAIANCELRIMDLADLVACDFKIDVGSFDVLYVRDPYLNGSAEFLPRIVALAKRFKSAGKKVVDSTIADGEIGKGKWSDYRKLQKAGLPIPLTSINRGRGFKKYQYPFILKWVYGFKAKDVYLMKNQEQLKNILPLHPKNEWLLQKFIQAEYEYKIITIGYKALPVALRFKSKDGGFRMDFKKYQTIQTPTTSPRFAGYSSLKKEERLREMSEDNCGASPPAKEGWLAKRDGVVGADKIKEIIQLAESASRLLGRELAKVDILESKGKLYILEVNRFPGLKSFEILTGHNTTKDFLGYLTK
jgi:glutathione synthase/RimK-type ligase-like ATP-grasp enzyme